MRILTDHRPTLARLVRAIALLVLLLDADFEAWPAEPVQFSDDFSGDAEGSSGEPHWDALHVGFSVRAKTMHADVPDGRGFAVLRAVPFGKALSIEATVTPIAARGGQWKTAGLGVFIDPENFWHIAMVEAPDGNHFIEVSEMLAGHWNAQAEPETRIPISEQGRNFAWQYGTPYRLRFTLADQDGRTAISAELLEGAVTRFHAGGLLGTKAVDRGRPMLTATSMEAAFGSIKASVAEPAGEPPAPAQSFTPFTSSPLSSEPTGAASGFFRTESEGDRWWLADPNGTRTLSIGTDHVKFEGHWCEALGYSPYRRNVEKKFRQAEAWARDAAQRLRDWNFNVVGAGSSREIRRRSLAHTEFLSFGADFSGIASLVEKTTWTGWPDVFDPRFERFCELRARERCDPARDDPWLLGYFLDNELEWWGKSHRPWGLAEDACKLPASAPGKRALVSSLRAFFKDDIGAFAETFGTKIRNFDDLLAASELPQPKSDRAKEALAAFVAEAAGRYFKITTAAVRRHDANHLILGCRFAHDAPESAWVQAGATCEVVSVNVYPRIDLWHERVIGNDEHLRRCFALCRKPIIVTEWSFPALDAKDTNGRAIPSQHGAGMRVDTQEQKANCYAIFQRELFTLPFVIGSHWFMWSDEPALGISSSFPEDGDYGLVSETDEPYAAITATAKCVNPQLLALHAGKISSADVKSGPPPLAKPASFPPAKGTVKLSETGSGCTIETARLRLVKTEPRGAIFEHIFWRVDEASAWIELGSFEAVMNWQSGGQNFWPHAERVTARQVHEQRPERLVLDIECTHDSAPAWKAAYRFTFEAGLPWFRTQCLWVENASDRGWQLRGYFHFLPSKIGGDANDDEKGIGGITNYWLKAASWRDPKLQLHYGALPPQGDERMHVDFYKEGALQHPDCWRKIERDLAPGQRWTAGPDEPVVLIFGLREAGGQPRPWLELLPVAGSL